MSYIKTDDQLTIIRDDASHYWSENPVKVSKMTLTSLDFAMNNIRLNLRGNIPFIKLAINPFDTNPAFTWSLFNRNPYSFEIIQKPKNFRGRTYMISFKRYQELYIDAVSKFDEDETNLNIFDRIDGFCAIMCKEVVGINEKIYVYFTFFKYKDNFDITQPLTLDKIIITPGGGGGQGANTGLRIPSGA